MSTPCPRPPLPAGSRARLSKQRGARVRLIAPRTSLRRLPRRTPLSSRKGVIGPRGSPSHREVTTPPWPPAEDVLAGRPPYAPVDPHLSVEAQLLPAPATPAASDPMELPGSGAPPADAAPAAPGQLAASTSHVATPTPVSMEPPDTGARALPGTLAGMELPGPGASPATTLPPLWASQAPPRPLLGRPRLPPPCRCSDSGARW